MSDASRANKTQDILFALDDLSGHVERRIDCALDDLILLGQFPNLRRDPSARKAVCREIGAMAAKALARAPNEANLPEEARHFFEDQI